MGASPNSYVQELGTQTRLKQTESLMAKSAQAPGKALAPLLSFLHLEIFNGSRRSLAAIICFLNKF